MIDQATRDLICERMALGESLRSICRDLGTPSEAYVRKVAVQDPEFGAQYARAYSMRADTKFDELDEVSEQAANEENGVRINGLRLKADNIKWQLARMNKARYGDKLDLEHAGAITLNVNENVL